MKKRYILLAGMCVIGMLAVGCGSKETTVEVTPTPTPTIEVSGKSNMVEMQQSVGIDKTKITKIMGTKTATSAELVITNNTGLEIDCFYTRPSGEEDWSEDYIQDKFTLLAGEQALFYYDPAAKDENGVSITKYDLKVSYTDEEESDCMFRNLTLSDIEELKLKMEDGIPFVTYTSLSTKQEVSTLEDAKARMGRTEDEDSENEEDEASDDDTSSNNNDSNSDTNADTDTDTDSSSDSENDSDSDNDFDSGNDDQEADDSGSNMRSAAEGTIGQSVDALNSACGGANSTEYDTDEESGSQIGYYYYDGFTVSTIEQDGQEIVTGVW